MATALRKIARVFHKGITQLRELSIEQEAGLTVRFRVAPWVGQYTESIPAAIQLVET